MPLGLVTEFVVITVAQSNYRNKDLDLPQAEEDAQAIHDHFSKMGVPEDKISHLVNPEKSEFFAAMEKVKRLAKNG